MNISQTDRNILRNLAHRQLEYANSELNLETIRRWYAHNTGEHPTECPLIHLEMWTFANELLPQRLRCEGEKARKIETQLYRNFLNHELFADDQPVANCYQLEKSVRLIPFGLPVQRQHAGSGVGHMFTHHIHDLEEDFEKLGPGQIIDNTGKTAEEKALLEDIFGDILPVKYVQNCLYSVPTQDLVHIMSMETMYFAMADCPDLFHQMMRQYTDDVLKFYRYLEAQDLLETTNGAESLGQGSWCFNNELPTAATKTIDLWGFMDSQETVGISPAMFREFIFPYYKEISENYGLLSYGCCEPVHAIWDDLSALKNLRKVSVSPWCEQEFMGDKLRGSKIIFHRKPSPNYLGVDKNLDEAALRAHIKETLLAARGCTLEITQRDVYTIHNNEAKARRYVEIIGEEIEKHW